MAYFNWVSTRNCRKFFKRHYTLQFGIDEKLVGELEEYGFLEKYEFSKYSKAAFDTFRIKLEDSIEIAGGYGNTILQVTVPKISPKIIESIEGVLNQWSINKKRDLVPTIAANDQSTVQGHIN